MELRTLYVRKDYSTEYVYEMSEEQRHRLLWSSYSPEKKKEVERWFRKKEKERRRRLSKEERQKEMQKSLGLNADTFYIYTSWDEYVQWDDKWLGGIAVADVSCDIPVSRADLKEGFNPKTGEWTWIEGLEDVLDPDLVPSYDSTSEGFQLEALQLALNIHAYDDKKRIEGLLRRLSVLSITGGPCPEIAETMAKLKGINFDYFVDGPGEEAVMALHALIAPLLEAERRLAATVSRVTSRTSRVQILTVRPSRGASRQRAPRSHRVAVSVRGGDSGDDDSGESDPPAPPYVNCNPTPLLPLWKQIPAFSGGGFQLFPVDLISRVPMADGHFAWTFGGV